MGSVLFPLYVIIPAGFVTQDTNFWIDSAKKGNNESGKTGGKLKLRHNVHTQQKLVSSSPPKK